MSYQPVDAIRAGISATHGGAAGTTQTDNILAAPGAGFRYRVWAWSVARRENVTTAVYGNLRETGGGAFLDTLALGTGAAAAAFQFPGGLACAANVGLDWQAWRTNGAAGTVTVAVTVIYTIERV